MRTTVTPSEERTLPSERSVYPGGTAPPHGGVNPPSGARRQPASKHSGGTPSAGSHADGPALLSASAHGGASASGSARALGGAGMASLRGAPAGGCAAGASKLERLPQDRRAP